MKLTQENPSRRNRDRFQLRWLLLTMAVLATLMFAAACGGGGEEASNGGGEQASEAADAAADDGDGSIPTMPAARFAAPTTMIDPTKVAEREREATPMPQGEPDLALGEAAYAKLCAECHGEAGEGVADKGEAIVGLVEDEAALDDLLRSGGGYGNEHIFGPSDISDDGIASLFAYAQTLTGE